MAETTTKKAHEITYPPFPTAPPGTIVTSFKDFEQRGIAKIPVSGKEVDSLGMPTVALKSAHSSDKCKTDARPRIINRYTKSKSASRVLNGNGTKKMEWWEEWELSDESAAILGYNSTISRTERFQKAVSDFNKSRTWPSPQHGVRALWDQFQTFIGQIDSTQPKSTKKQGDDEELQDDEDDFDDENKSDGAIQGPGQEQREAEEDAMTAHSEANEKMMAFLNNPATRVRIFLSTFIRRQGLHFTERNLFIVPTLLSSFVDYLLRNGVFADKKGDEAFKDAQKIVEIALVELPLTAKLAKLLPDDLNGALKETYAVRTPSQCLPVLDDGPEPIETPPQVDTTKGENQADSWGSGGNSWDTGFTLDSVDSWNTSDADIWGVDEANDDTVTSWLPPEPPSALPFLGPTTLPMTHQTGIREWSVRRIKSLSQPAAPLQKTAGTLFATPDVYGDPQAVESELVRKLWKVELEPWLGWEDGFQEPEAVLPRILPSSRGAVVIQEGVVFEDDSKEKVGVEEGKETQRGVYSSTSGVKPFKPTSDTISILVLPSVGEQLRVGMGLGGTWTQLLRQGDFVGDSVQQTKKSKAKAAGQRLWYMEELMVTLTSYHTV
ncbi:hypothetical protein AAF712_002748 [Marasmius tenuissimus]|uniref:Uncharacterized protein n=1 Tax=Marasmius tenuissimus TaxID=585030 RepID=A0ABR3A8N3_9AGAR